MSYKTILLSEAQLPRSSVCGEENDPIGLNQQVSYETGAVPEWCAMSHLHRVKTDGAEAVDAPGEGADGGAPLLVPDVHLVATCCKHSALLVMVQSCEHCLKRDASL